VLNGILPSDDDAGKVTDVIQEFLVTGVMLPDSGPELN
jgi:hypothetical protein